MKTIFDATARKDSIARISGLDEGRKAQWGKMDYQQMLEHCIRFDEWILGINDPVYKQSFLGRIFGKMALKSTLKDEPMKRNMPAGADFVVKGKGGDADLKKTRWIGLLRIERVAKVRLSSLSEKDARLAGYDTLKALLAELSARDGGSFYRIDLHREGPDPRIALREKSGIPPEELDLLKVKLNRFDASGPHGPWTQCVMESILERPKEKAGDMSLRLGFPRDWLKINIRKLKNPGLTISHEPGYELSPRGETAA